MRHGAASFLPEGEVPRLTWGTLVAALLPAPPELRLEPEELRRGDPVGEAVWPLAVRVGERPRDPDLLLEALDDFEPLRFEERAGLLASGLPEPEAPRLPVFLLIPLFSSAWV